MGTVHRFVSRKDEQEKLVKETIDALDRAMGEDDYVNKRLAVAEVASREIRDAPQIAYDKHHVLFTIHIKRFVDQFAESREERNYLFARIKEELSRAADAVIAQTARTKNRAARLEKVF